MQTALLFANFALKAATALVFAYDGDMMAAATFTIAAPLTTWFWSQT